MDEAVRHADVCFAIHKTQILLFYFCNNDFIFYFIWNATPHLPILTSNILINITSFFLDLDHYKLQGGDIEY